MSDFENHIGIANRGGSTSPDFLVDDMVEQVVERFYAEWKAATTDGGVAPVATAPSPKPQLTGEGIAPAHISAILKGVFAPGTRGKPRPYFSPQLAARRHMIRALAEDLLGSNCSARRWFATPFKHALGGSTPIDLMETMDGCERVDRFLRSLYPSED